MKILTVIGARPQFIKAAVVSRAVEEHNRVLCSRTGPIEEVIVHTGQHYDDNMSEVFFRELKLPLPHYNLEVGSGTHGTITGRMLVGVEEVILLEKPDMVLVYGDTNSTLAGALAAAKLHVPVAHVEAGLRSYNMRMPEEVNRILTDRVSRWLFCPTVTAVRNLEKEGVYSWPGAEVHNVGDVMYDAILYYRKIAVPSPGLVQAIHELGGLYYLATVHRAENTDDPDRLKEIMTALDDIARQIPVVLPLHPHTRRQMKTFGIALENASVIDPVGYFDMLYLLEQCRGVFTDSGGLQKEAYFLGKPCVTLREETEWVELVDAEANVLAGSDYRRIWAAAKRMEQMSWEDQKCIYGYGEAGQRIVEVLAESL